jgi:hypothetical protein
VVVLLAVWAGLALLVAAFFSGALFAFVRGRTAYRAFKTAGSDVTGGLERISRDADAIVTKLERLAAGGARLESALARLAVSRARLKVLTAAIDDVRDAIRRVTAIYPRK